MSMTSKSPSKVAALAYEAGKNALPRYAHKYSRRDFTCAQLFAILVLRKFFKQDYRGTVAFLGEWSDLRTILELDDKVPHYTTLQKNNAKLLNDALLRKLLKQTLEQFYRYPKHAQIDYDDMAWMLRIDLAAGDSNATTPGTLGDRLVRNLYFGTTGLAEVRYTKPASPVALIHHGGDADGDYEGYDRFYRTVDQYWWQNAASPARIKYGYDRGSRRVYHEDVFAAAATADLDQGGSRGQGDQGARPLDKGTWRR